MKKRVIIASVATAAVLGVGGAVYATTASASDVKGGDRDRVAAAAVQAAGGGTATDMETSDDQGEAYEVEVRKDDGSEVDVTLDKDLKVVTQEADDADDADDAAEPAQPAVTDAERESAGKAALAAVGSGTVTQVERSDDAGQAFEVDVTAADGAEWDVELDAAFKVLSKNAD